MDLGLSGKRALVFGATRGLGRAVAEILAAEGADLMLSGRDRSRLEEARQALGAKGRNVEIVSADLAERESVTGLLEQVGAVSRIDILINNTGGPSPGPVTNVTAAQWSAQFEAMVNSVFRITAHFVPGMRERKWGRVVNIVSSGVIQPIPNLGMSNALRLALVGWAKTLSMEVAADGVTVNSVAPGRIHTQRVDELDAAAAKRDGKSVEAIAAASRSTIPIGRYGDPREFADVVAFLASARASYVTGSLVRVDGGMIRAL